MTLQEALDHCSICDLFNPDVSDDYKFQVVDKLMSVPCTRVPKTALANCVVWLLKKLKWQKDSEVEK